MKTICDKSLIKDWTTPDFSEVILARQDIIHFIRQDQQHADFSFKWYKTHPVEFINHFLWTHDPRKKGRKKMPFILFKRQEEYIVWLFDRFTKQRTGIARKNRDMGASWLNCAFTVFVWLFYPDSSVALWSRKEIYVDKAGDMDSLFEKCRFLIRNLPFFWIPEGFSFSKHMTYMKILNPFNKSVIKGEAGSYMGRGGRTTLGFLDEADFLEQPLVTEAAISVTAECIIYTSTLRGGNSWFYVKYKRADDEQKFRFKWEEDPRKTQEWYDQKKKEMDPLIFALEIEGDINFSYENIVIKNDHLIAATKANVEKSGKIIAGFDVADEGRDKHAVYIRHGNAYLYHEEWALGDTSQAAQKCFSICEQYKVEVINYDAIGVGAGAKAEFKKLIDSAKERKSKFCPQIIPVLIGNRDIKGFFSTGKRNRDMFYNQKAMIWWNMRLKFQRTFDFINGEIVESEHIINIPDNNELIEQLSQQQYESKDTGHIIMKKKSDVYAKSPNLADALILSFAGSGYTDRELFIF